MAGHAAGVLTHCAIKRMCGMGGGGGDIYLRAGQDKCEDLYWFFELFMGKDKEDGAEQCA